MRQHLPIADLPIGLCPPPVLDLPRDGRAPVERLVEPAAVSPLDQRVRRPQDLTLRPGTPRAPVLRNPPVLRGALTRDPGGVAPARGG